MGKLVNLLNVSQSSYLAVESQDYLAYLICTVKPDKREKDGYQRRWRWKEKIPVHNFGHLLNSGNYRRLKADHF